MTKSEHQLFMYMWQVYKLDALNSTYLKSRQSWMAFSQTTVSAPRLSLKKRHVLKSSTTSLCVSWLPQLPYTHSSVSLRLLCSSSARSSWLLQVKLLLSPGSLFCWCARNAKSQYLRGLFSSLLYLGFFSQCYFLQMPTLAILLITNGTFQYLQCLHP